MPRLGMEKTTRADGVLKHRQKKITEQGAPIPRPRPRSDGQPLVMTESRQRGIAGGGEQSTPEERSPPSIPPRKPKREWHAQQGTARLRSEIGPEQASEGTPERSKAEVASAGRLEEEHVNKRGVPVYDAPARLDRQSSDSSSDYADSEYVDVGRLERDADRSSGLHSGDDVPPVPRKQFDLRDDEGHAGRDRRERRGRDIRQAKKKSPRADVERQRPLHYPLTIGRHPKGPRDRLTGLSSMDAVYSGSG